VPSPEPETDSAFVARIAKELGEVLRVAAQGAALFEVETLERADPRRPHRGVPSLAWRGLPGATYQWFNFYDTWGRREQAPRTVRTSSGPKLDLIVQVTLDRPTPAPRDDTRATDDAY
jgi:hypothetical protein